MNHRDHDTGSIREGYLADLVVISPDPFQLPASDICTSEVDSTWIGGRRVYGRTTAVPAPAASANNNRES